ncbi:UNVERIFIED_ORG: alpha-tubulin suppressor-like RCC1 family protein [Arthrobacter sp. UYEF10]
MPVGTQFFSEIYWLAGRGISTGWTEADGSKTYRPLQAVNRDAMAAFLYRLAGSPAYSPPAVTPFADVPVGIQFYKEITWLADEGISTGWTETDGSKTFRPLQAVNRDAMAAFMYRFDSSPAYSPPGTSPFRDVEAGAQFYKEVSWLAAKGISTGWAEADGSKTFRPLQAVNRDAMAAFMYRLYQLKNPPQTTPLQLSSTWPWAGVGEPYYGVLSASGGTSPYTYTITGTIPAGLTLNTSIGQLTGTPTAGGTTALKVTVTDALGAQKTVDTFLPVAPSPLTNIKAVETISSSSFAVGKDGRVWAWGLNYENALGLSPVALNSALVTIPMQIPGLSGIDSIHAVSNGSSKTVFAVTTNGNVWAWGNNSNGEFGDGTTNSSATPVQVSTLSGVKSIASTSPFSGHSASLYAVKTDGTVSAWGDNVYGQLGNGTTTASKNPTMIPGLPGVKSISTNLETAYAIKTDGSLWAWGDANGSSGLGTVLTDSQGVNLPYSPAPVQVKGVAGVTSLAQIYGNAIYALQGNGEVKAWGRGYRGELGNGTTDSSVTPVTVQGLTGVTGIAATTSWLGGGGAGHAVKADGTVWSWGANSDGQLGNGVTEDSSIPVKTVGPLGVREVAASGASTYALTQNGTIWAWGANSSGQMGNGTTASSTLPATIPGVAQSESIQAKNGSIFALTLDGPVLAWGANSLGQLGNHSTAETLIPGQVGW